MLQSVRSSLDRFVADEQHLDSILVCLRWTLAVSAAVPMVAFVLIAAVRMSYPFELEWMEGASLEHVRRILSGLPLYVKPSIEFVPLGYAPFYYYCSALGAALLGVGFLPLRLVSTMAAIGCFWLLFIWVRKETDSRLAGLLAAGLFAATFEISGWWFDLARVDSLFMMLFIAGSLIVRRSSAPVAQITAAVLLCLAFHTKQTALPMTVPVLVYAFLQSRRHPYLLPGVFVVLLVASSIWLARMNEDGWYAFYVWHLQGQRGLRWLQLPFTLLFVVSHFALTVLLGACYAVVRIRLNAWSDLGFWVALGAGMVGSAAAAKLQDGAYYNNLVPIYAYAALLFGIGFNSLRQWTAVAKSKPLMVFVYLLCLCQVAAFIYDPTKQIPSTQDEAAGRQLVEAMARTPGEVFVPSHGYLAILAGKNGYAHTMAIRDLCASGCEGGTDTGIRDIIRAAIRERRFSAIVSDEYDSEYRIADDYTVAKQPLFQDRNRFMPVTGFRTRPEIMYVRK